MRTSQYIAGFYQQISTQSPDFNKNASCHKKKKKNFYLTQESTLNVSGFNCKEQKPGQEPEKKDHLSSSVKFAMLKITLVESSFEESGANIFTMTTKLDQRLHHDKKIRSSKLIACNYKVNHILGIAIEFFHEIEPVRWQLSVHSFSFLSEHQFSFQLSTVMASLCISISLTLCTSQLNNHEPILQPCSSFMELSSALVKRRSLYQVEV